MSSNAKREFTVENTYQYNYRDATRWLLSHMMRYWWFAVIAVVLALLNSVGQSAIAYYTGQAFDVINQSNPDRSELRSIVLYIFGLGVMFGLAQWGRNLAMEMIAQRAEREIREELYISLLGKSQTFHDRQRIGDIMARATDDVRQVNFMINPGIMLILGSGVFSDCAHHFNRFAAAGTATRADFIHHRFRVCPARLHQAS